MKTIVVDTCVIVDMYLPNRPRHEAAITLLAEIKKHNIQVRLPAFAMFEISHAIKQEKRLNDSKLMDKNHEFAGEGNGLAIDLIPIDEAFISKYLDVSLPEIRAGDLVFAALAKGDNLPLISEDKPFMKKAREADISTFTIEEYLKAIWHGHH